jgi:aspartate kinase
MPEIHTLVMKFGGAAVASPEQFSRIADIIISRKDQFQRIVVVVSAMGDTTDQLIALAKKVNTDPPRREYDMLVTVGERISCSLLAMALAAKGCDAMSFTGSQSGIITCTRHTEAKIIDVRPTRILPLLEAGIVVIVAGFQGVSSKGEITTLGRGGSDTTAVALGVTLQASIVEFFKDVPGVFEEDPKKNPDAAFFEKISYSAALNVVSQGGKILHPRCIQLAYKNFLPLKVRSFKTFGTEKDGQSTLIFENGIRPEKPSYEEVDV